MSDSPFLIESVAFEENTVAHVNALHAVVQQASSLCGQQLETALCAAWQAGHLLRDEKKKVRRSMGHGVWVPWLEKHFTGSIRTAQRYMLLSKNVPDVSQLKEVSLRQAYLLLGIASERKNENREVQTVLRRHQLAANRLVRAVREFGKLEMIGMADRKMLQRDLCAVHQILLEVFQDAPVNTRPIDARRQ